MDTLATLRHTGIVGYHRWESRDEMGTLVQELAFGMITVQLNPVRSRPFVRCSVSAELAFGMITVQLNPVRSQPFVRCPVSTELAFGMITVQLNPVRSWSFVRCPVSTELAFGMITVQLNPVRSWPFVCCSVSTEACLHIPFILSGNCSRDCGISGRCSQQLVPLLVAYLGRLSARHRAGIGRLL
jgi:Na+-transporting NADH:ubiquinone oxidoreductase subunit NqrB